MAKEKDSSTPLMKQYDSMKRKYPDAILLYRMGDFYETFGEDAVIASKILGITLTKRNHGSPGDDRLAGFPHHSIDTYLPKLIRAGKRVAICEQLEDPKKTKTLVKRGVIELVTPGVSYTEYGQDARTNTFLASVFINKSISAISLLDLTTGEFLVTEGSTNIIDKVLNGFRPKEVIFIKGREQEFKQNFGNNFYIYPIEPWFFDMDSCREKIIKQFDVTSLKGFGIDKMTCGISCIGAILNYLEITKHNMIQHITSISKIDENNNMLLDKYSLQNLEILSSEYEGGKSLIDVLDHTTTPMGGRKIRRWLCMPLVSPEKIDKRLNIVEYFTKDDESRIKLITLLGEIGDIERLTSKIGVGRINPREMNQIKNALAAIRPFKELCLNTNNEDIITLVKNLTLCEELYNKINTTLKENAPFIVSKGGVIAEGINTELDELRDISHHGKELLLKLQQREMEATGISNLKVGFNNVFGYYIEVSKGQKDKAPEQWIRKQTLVNGERYITPELKEYEDKILGAEEKIQDMESSIYYELVVESTKYINELQQNSKILASLDVLISFAEVSLQNQYKRPVVNESDDIIIKGGRHPVIERQLPDGEEYIANDLKLDTKEQQIIIITGPNMAGKSALLRQTALIVIMAQAGCFVPVESAEIGYLDKIFTRVGASDNISQGESTFMVEMNEASNILNNISSRCLILFDELGRGTSTYDGISIAWAIVEYLHENPKYRAKTLFATHYHELNEMESSFSRIKNYNITVKEIDHKVIFLRKLVRGGSNHSFGIQVGRMAGLPKSVIRRANQVLKALENKGGDKSVKSLGKNTQIIAENGEGYQLSFFQLEDPILNKIRDKIKDLDINATTPIDALNKLSELKKLLKS